MRRFGPSTKEFTHVNAKKERPRDSYKDMMEITKRRDVNNAYQKQARVNMDLATKRTMENQLHNLLFQDISPGLRGRVLRRLKMNTLGMFV